MAPSNAWNGSRILSGVNSPDSTIAVPGGLPASWI